MRRALLFVGLVLTLLPGCGGARLAMESTFDVPIEGRRYTIDAIKREQTIKVSASASGAPVGVFVFLEKDEAAAMKEIFAKKFTSLVLAKAEKTEQTALEARIPANETAVVYISREGVKGANVKLKITN